MSGSDTTVESIIHQVSDADSGLLYIPADVQRSLGISIDDPVEVTIEDIGHDFIDSVSFENPQTAGDKVTVPADLMRTANLADETVGVTFDLPESEEDQVADAAESESESEDGLGELFG